jgi:predicted N-acyltransferase
MPRIVKKILEKVSNHRLRHRSTGFGFALADQIAFLDGARWDQAVGGASLFLGRDYLGALEATAPENLSPRYALISRGAEPVAAVVAQVLRAEGRRWLKDEPKGLAKKVVSGLKARMLVCGNLLSWGCHGVAFAAGQDRSALWPAVAEALHRIRRSDHLLGETDLLLVKDLADADAAGAEALRPYSFRPLETEPDMMLEIPEGWKSHDDYLAGLTSSYRQSAKKVFKEIEKSGCRVERLADLAPHAARLHALYLQVHENAAVRPVTLSPDYLPALSRALDDRFRCAAIRRGDEILGFVVTLRDGDTGVGYYLGFDRAAAAELPLYLRLLHAVVEDAIAMGCRRISLGRTALDPKARLGARPRPMRVWVRHTHPWLNLIVRGVLGAIPHEEAPERNPFKGGPS